MPNRNRRLPDFDYSTPGAYFVTISAYERRMLFEDEVVQDVIVRCWSAIPEHLPNVSVDSFVVMPNHVHGILMIEADRAVRALYIEPVRPGPRKRLPSGSLSLIVQSFKAAVTRELRREGLIPPNAKVWLYSFHDRVIRDDDELTRIRAYIANNPAQWAHDHENPDHAINAQYMADWGWLEGAEAQAVS